MKFASIVFLLGLLVITSCKKGDEDPAFSLLTRKARLSGSWTGFEGSGVRSYSLAGNTYKENSKLENFSATIDLTGQGLALDYTDKSILRFTFDRDKTAEFQWEQKRIHPVSLELYNHSLTKKGTWQWEDDGSVNRKDVRVKVLEIEERESCLGCDTTRLAYTEENAPSFLLRLDRLSRREIIGTLEDYAVFPSHDTDSLTLDLTLIKD